MKIYTRKGDTGHTSLTGGKIVDKHHTAVDAYGSIDELNSFIGLLKDYIEDKKIKEVLHDIQLKLFSIGSILASDEDVNFSEKVNIGVNDIEGIELNIDNMNDQLPELKNFIIPGGHKVSSYCHVCRSICRRAERRISELNNQHKISPCILSYINRLSDFFFVLSRHINHSNNIEETYW